MSSFRIGGIASGMDTESIVRDLMRVQRLPLQCLEKDKQIWLWRQESYRNLNMSLLALRNKAFDMRLQAPYLVKKATSTNETVLSVTAGASAHNATYNINVTSLASAASTYSTAPVGENIQVKDALHTWVGGVSPTDTFSFYLRDTENATGAISNFNVDTASIKGVAANASASIGTKDGKLNIRAKDTGALLNGYTINFVNNEEQDEIKVQVDTVGDSKVITVTANLAQEDLKLADIAQAINEEMGENEQISLSATGKYELKDLDGLELSLSGGVDEVQGQYSFSIAEDKAFAAGEYITINGQSFKGVTGTADATKGEFSVDGDATAQMESLVQAINANKVLNSRFEPATLEGDKITLIEKEGQATGRDITSPVNGIGFDFTYGDSLEKVISTVNNNKLAGVTMFFDEGTKSLVVTSKETGAAKGINIFDNVGSFMTGIMNINTTDKDGDHYTKGTDAEFTLNGLKTTRSTNNFQINNVTFNLKSKGEATVEIQGDTDKVVENIKEFVELYNKTLDEVYGKLNEERFRNFAPLTKEQRDEMSEKDIELWEEKAKSGLLQRDGVLSNAMNALRRIMTSTVDDLEISNIFDLGMKTGSYRENGKIYIDEEKLREAIENNPEGVMKLFNNDSEGNLGIARQLQNELDKTMKSISERAGSSTNLYDQSTIGKTLKNIDDQIFRMEERLARMEDRYWKQFTAMEQALQAMYQQGDWLAQQMMIMGG